MDKNFIKIRPEALSNGATPKLNFLVSGRISVVMSIFSVFGLSYGRSGNEICAEEGQTPIFDPLPRKTKNCVASLLYEMGYPFRSTVFCTYGILEHFLPQVKRGSHSRRKIISVTVVRGPATQCTMLP